MTTFRVYLDIFQDGLTNIGQLNPHLENSHLPCKVRVWVLELGQGTSLGAVFLPFILYKAKMWQHSRKQVVCRNFLRGRSFLSSHTALGQIYNNILPQEKSLDAPVVSPPANAETQETQVNPWLGRSLEEKWKPALQMFFPGRSQGQRSIHGLQSTMESQSQTLAETVHALITRKCKKAVTYKKRDGELI